jgi:tetratricopeptide (TPR) repeat protein
MGIIYVKSKHQVQLERQVQTKRRDAIIAAAGQYLYGYVVELDRAHLQSYPDDGIAWIVFAEALTELSRYDEAEAALDKALIYAHEMLKEIIFTRRAEMYQRQGKYLEAEIWYRKAIEERPDYAGNYIMPGLLAFQRGDFALAEHVHHQGIACSGERMDECYAHLGGVLVAQERYEEAEACYLKALEIDPHYKWAKLCLRDVKKILKLNHKKQARAEDRDAIYHAWDKKLYGYGIELARKYLHAYPEDGVAWLLFAQVLTPLSRFAEAEVAFDNAFAYTEERWKHSIFAGRAKMYERQGKYLEAESWYRKAAAAAPDYAFNYVYLGILAFRRGDFALAEQMQRQGTTCSKGECMDECYGNLGSVFVAQERYEEAEACYLKALEIDPDYKWTKLRLRDVRKILKLTNKKKAID